MIKSGIDQDALVKMFSEATTKQGETLRRNVSDITLKALQGRELSLENIRKVIKSVTQAASAGAAQNPAAAVETEALLGNAFAGMDNALLQAVEANRKALKQFVDQGVGLQEKQMKTALDGIEKMEDMFFSTVRKAATTAGDPMQGPWEHVLTAMKQKGTATGSQASSAVEQLLSQTQTALRDTRAASLRGARAMLDGYAALVSGVLIGMSEGLQSGSTAPTKPAAKSRKA
jgi:hypothetical protein